MVIRAAPPVPAALQQEQVAPAVRLVLVDPADPAVPVVPEVPPAFWAAQTLVPQVLSVLVVPWVLPVLTVPVVLKVPVVLLVLVVPVVPVVP